MMNRQLYGMEPGEEVSVDIERGKTLIIRYLTTGDLRDDGTRTVFFELNGQPRDVTIIDRGAAVRVKRRPKAEAGNPDHVGAPMPGKVSAVFAVKGQLVAAGSRLLALEAMKTESAVTSPRNATVGESLVAAGQSVDGGDLLFILA